MSETKWTPEQQAAITLKDCNLLVAAAAGAGKTAVLVERIIQKIIDENNPADIDSLLVVTFTNAAATEMRERIGAAISKAIEEKKDSKNINRQLALLNKAAITTIHSFCLEVIRSNFQSLDIDPRFRILDETEASLLKIETVNELFEEIYEDEENNRDFFDLLESYGSNRDDQKIQDMLLNTYSFVQSYPWPEQWLNSQVENYNPDQATDFGKTLWGKILLQTVKIRLEGLIDLSEAACGKLEHAAGLEKYLPLFLDEAGQLKGLKKVIENTSGAEQSGWDEICTFLNDFSFEILPRCGKDADRQIQDSVKKTRDEIKEYIGKLKEEVFYQKSSDIISELKAMYPVLKCVTRLVLNFSERYSAKKNMRSSVDFNDLEHLCLKVLSEADEEGKIVPTQAAKAYKARFSEILVDEYQDSNLVQEIIIGMISREDSGTPNVFMVGDVKQSIYRFRQAKPELFLDKYNSYSGQPDSLYRKILLFKNFRSRKEVVDSINFIFEQIMSESVGELDYTEIEKLNPGASYLANEEPGRITGGAVELHLMDTAAAPRTEAGGQYEAENEDDPEMEEEEILDNIQKEARMVANRIISLLQPDKAGRKFSVFDRKINGYRDVQFKDIVILLRTTKNWTEVFSDELARVSIPTFADTGSGFFKTPEVQVVLSLLQIIDNPYQDIPLLAVLRSPVAGFSTDHLAELRLADRKSALFDALKLLAGTRSEAGEKACLFLERLEQWRSMSLYMSTHKLIWQLYNDTGYFSIVGAMQDGKRKQANLRVLFERSLQFEKTSYKGLFNFISFIDKLKTSKGDMGSAKVLGENDNVVRLMSIHKSKGLEFPVVFLCGCGKKFNLQDMYKSILLHQELGFGPDFVDYRKRLKYPSVPKLAIAQKVKLETLSEEMRILYVALTRAREKLILTGAVSSLEKAIEKWLAIAGAQNQSSKFPAYEMLKAQNYLDWICPAVIRHGSSGLLREAAGPGVEYRGIQIDDASLWDIYLYNQDDIAVAKKFENEDEQDFDVISWARDSKDTGEGKVDGKADEIHRRLSWKYQYGSLTTVPAKISVTEIKRYFNINNEGEDTPAFRQPSIRKPAFLQEKKGLSPAEKGTIMHFIMQHMDLKNTDIESQLTEMISKDLITKQQAGSVDILKIERFLNSPIGRRMVAADAGHGIHREVPFNIELPADELFGAVGKVDISQEKILLQGVIDCYFEEDGELVLIDYKTDYIPNGSTDEIKAKYQLQIEYYSRALKMLTGLSIKERCIYLFATGELINM